MSFETGLFIGGKYVASSTNTTLTIHNPADGTLVSDLIQVASQEDVDNAVNAAKVALPAWRDCPSAQRSAIMHKFANLIEENGDRLADLEHQCMGQPIALARSLSSYTASLWRYFAGLAGSVPGESFPPDGDGRYKIVAYEPLGVCAGINAWNAANPLAATKIAPALAAGNTMIMKSSEKSPLGLAQWGHLINKAGFPPGVLNILAGDSKVGEMLASHMSIAKIAFTGSVAAGRAVQVAAARSNLKRVTLELGGKSPALVFEDADLDNAILHCGQSFLVNSGQACYAASRVFVHESIAPAFIQAVKSAFQQAEQNMEDSRLAGTFAELGPLADKKQLDHVMRLVDSGKSDGVEILTGGARRGETGTFVQPTIFLNPDLKSKVYTDEIFGPVLCIRTFKDEDEVIRLANDTEYGLNCNIFTRDIGRALRVASQIESGTISINAACMPSFQTPFGGYKQSGYGRECGIEGMKGYMQMKTISLPLKS